LQQTILALLKVKPNYTFTENYKADYENTDDYRTILSPKEPLINDRHYTVKPYHQVFQTKFGFIENLSIVDLLFNEGSRANEFI
jgi:hypothetical protein